MVFAALPFLVLSAQGPATAQDLDVNALASGPYSRMHMRLEKTILSVDVLRIEMRFDRQTQQRLQHLASGRRFADNFVAPIADAAIRAEQVFVDLAFERHVSLERWVEGVRESLEMARRSGLIPEERRRHVSDNLPRWFQAVAARGFEKGDHILYRGYPERMRTVLVSNQGAILVDQTDRGASPRRALLAGYFAPGTDFRKPLVQSLFQP